MALFDEAGCRSPAASEGESAGLADGISVTIGVVTICSGDVIATGTVLMSTSFIFTSVNRSDRRGEIVGGGANDFSTDWATSFSTFRATSNESALSLRCSLTGEGK